MLRRIIRQAVRYAHLLGAEGTFTPTLVGGVRRPDGRRLPELRTQADGSIEHHLLREDALPAPRSTSGRRRAPGRPLGKAPEGAEPLAKRRRLRSPCW